MMFLVDGTTMTIRKNFAKKMKNLKILKLNKLLFLTTKNMIFN